jgi:hypothetical protein
VTDSASDKAVRLLPGKGITIDPRHVPHGQTLVMAFTERRDQAAEPEKPEVQLQFSAYVVEGQAKPCVVVDDPLWGDVYGPGRPPTGSWPSPAAPPAPSRRRSLTVIHGASCVHRDQWHGLATISPVRR